MSLMSVNRAKNFEECYAKCANLKAYPYCKKENKIVCNECLEGLPIFQKRIKNKLVCNDYNRNKNC